MGSIKQWAEDDRPREKMLLKGKAALSNAELLAIILGSGNREETAVGLAKRIFRSVENSWTRLARLSSSDLAKFKGIGPAKAISILTVMEIARRLEGFPRKEQARINNSQQLVDLLAPHLRDLVHEEFWVIYLDKAHHVLKVHQLSKGGVGGTTVDAKLLFKMAFECTASAFVMAHNHPSGNLRPSVADEKLTQKIKTAAKSLDLVLLDHLILSQDSYLSFADTGLL